MTLHTDETHPDLIPDPARQALLDALSGIGAAFAFAAGGAGPSALPGLWVEGVGSVGLPVDPGTAQALSAAAERAPYGLGEETLVDERVRSAWQIAPGRLRFENPKWEVAVSRIVKRAMRAFAIEQPVRHEFYKLLVYEAGGHFAPHVDSEKTDGMFATLVIVLPSRHEGGRLVVRHAGREEAFDFGGGPGAFATHWAAFYADCEHELKPVMEGHRIALIYNLVHTSRNAVPSAPAYSTESKAITVSLRRLFDDVGLDRIAVSLDHEYSEAGLRPAALKGADRARWEVLRSVAFDMELDMHLALLTHHQYGDAFAEPVYGSRRGRGDWWGPDSADMSMGNVHDETFELGPWVDAQGRALERKPMAVDAAEIVRDPDLQPYYEEEVSGPTGNAGIEMTRWYREAVIVLWPRARFVMLLAREGPDVAVPALTKLVESTDNPADDPACLRFATAIIADWEAGRHVSGRDPNTGPMLAALARIGDGELAETFIGRILPGRLTVELARELRELCETVGWARCQEALVSLVPEAGGRTLATSPAVLAALTARLCLPGPSGADPGHHDVCRALCLALLDALPRLDYEPSVGIHACDALDRRDVLPPLARCLSIVGELDRLTALVEHALLTPERYDLRKVLVPAVVALRGSGDAALRSHPSVVMIHKHCVDALRETVAAPPQPPADWRRAAVLEHACSLCQELATFAADPESEVHRFKIARPDRQHLRDQIDYHELDMRYATESESRPYTLVLTKTQASYERARRRFEEDRASLAALQR